MQQEIERYPSCPSLTPAEIDLVSRTVFVSSNPQKADVLFVFGSAHGDKWEQVAALFNSGLAPAVYVAGGKDLFPGHILSHLIRDKLVAYGVSYGAIVVDERSTNTLEDAVFGREIFLRDGIRHERILFACKPPHGGRCMRTLQKVFPESQLFPFTYDFVHEGQEIKAGFWRSWWKHDQARSIVWGEYQRIMSYSARNDICA